MRALENSVFSIGGRDIEVEMAAEAGWILADYASTERTLGMIGAQD